MQSTVAQNNYQELVNDKVFKQDVQDFSDMLEMDLNQRNSKLGQKYEFNFSND
jgi:hypothetical protein